MRFYIPTRHAIVDVWPMLVLTCSSRPCELYSQGWYSTRVRHGNEELSFIDEFRYLGHVMTAHCRDDKDIKKQFGRQNAVGNMLVRKFPFAPKEAKIQLFKLYSSPIYECALWRHSFQNSIGKFIVSYSDTFNRLINVPVCTRSILVFAMNATDHIHVVFRKFACSLMSRVIACHSSIVTAIVNIDAYQQFALMDKCRVCYVYWNKHRLNYLSICQCVPKDFN